MKRKRVKIFSGLIAVIVISYLFSAYLKGYFPMPVGVRKLYYVLKVSSNRPISGSDNLIDKNFLFSKEKYSVSKNIDRLPSIPHIFVLALIDTNNSVPLNYRFQGELNIQIYRQGELVYSEIVNSAINNYEHDPQGKPSKLYAFELLKTPFPLKGKAYKDIKVQITVLEPDIELLKYTTDSAVLSLVPVLRL